MVAMTSTTAFAKDPFQPTPEFERKLDRLAEVAVRAGLGLAPGQELLVTATLDAVALARRIAGHAYRAGASLVTTLFSDEQSALIRFRNGAQSSFDAAPSWLYEAMAQAYRSGAARLAITGNDPSLLSAENPEHVSRANRATSKAYRPALELIAGHAINWTIVANATPEWAAAVFPESAAGRGAGEALGCNLYGFPRGPAGPVGRVENARREPARARRPDEREALRGAAFPRTAHGSSRGSGRRPSVARRRHHGEQRKLLHPEYSDRGDFHDAAQRSSGRARDEHEALVASGDAD